MKFVTTALGGDREHAASGSPILWHVAAGEDVHLVHEFHREVAASGIAATAGDVALVADSETDIREAQTVDEVGVLWRSRARDGNAEEVRLHRGSSQGQTREAPDAAVACLGGRNGDVLGEGAGDGKAGLGRADVDDWRPFHRHGCLRGRGADQKLDVDAQGLVGIEGDASSQVGRVILPLEPKGISARRQLGNAVSARRVRDCHLLTLQLGRIRGHHDIGNRRLRRAVDHRSRQCADPLALRPN